MIKMSRNKERFKDVVHEMRNMHYAIKLVPSKEWEQRYDFLTRKRKLIKDSLEIDEMDQRRMNFQTMDEQRKFERKETLEQERINKRDFRY